MNATKKNTNCSKEQGLFIDNDAGWQALAARVVVQAIRDYEHAVAHNIQGGENGIKSLRKFFNSELCEMYLSLGLGMDVSYEKGEILAAIDRIVASPQKDRRRA